jgi:hypothetical protein
MRSSGVSAYDRAIAVRLVSLVSVVLLAGAGIYVVTDRSRLATRIAGRQASYHACARSYSGSNERKQRERLCGWSQLSQIRRGDLIGIPFLALALGLSFLLVYKIAHQSTDGGAPKVGDSRPEDPIM